VVILAHAHLLGVAAGGEKKINAGFYFIDGAGSLLELSS
jgi:hypothetical protein